MKTTKMLKAALLAACCGFAPSLALSAQKSVNAQSPGYGGTAEASAQVSSSAALNASSAAAASASEASSVKTPRQSVVFWFNVMQDANAIDFTITPTHTAPSQGGPTRTSRAMAMVTIAMYDAINAFKGAFEPYNDIGDANPETTSKQAAVAYAAHDVLVALYPDQTARLNQLLAADIGSIQAGAQKINRGRTLGQKSAAAILALRSNDNSQAPERAYGAGGALGDGRTRTFFRTPINNNLGGIGEWSPDPISGATVALGAFWGSVKPFALKNGAQFRIAPPPLPGSAAYATSFAQVAAIGGSPDNTGTPSTSTAATRFIGNYWGYDGVPGLGVPPRLYNQIALQVANDQGLNGAARLARYLAMVNVAQADSGIAAWDSKYFYNFWRPVTGIRRDDGVAATNNDPTWTPVGASVINTTNAIRPTPPFPAYPSGHATFGATVSEIMRAFFRDRPFTFVSDEYNGQGSDPFTPGVPRPLVPVRFNSFTEAQQENGISRIYNGVHWNFDDTSGQGLGVKVARQLLDKTKAFRVIRDDEDDQGDDD